MSIVVIATTPGMTAELYDQSQERMSLVGTLPPGCTAHLAGPGPNGWQVVAVWESTEALQRFATEKLQPTLAELGVTPPPAPPVIYPLHAQVG
jgi:hypothetical protein